MNTLISPQLRSDTMLIIIKVYKISGIIETSAKFQRHTNFKRDKCKINFIKLPKIVV